MRDIHPNNVRRISKSDIPINQPLPGPLLDKSGRVLVTANKCLAKNDIVQLYERVRDRVFVSDVDWPIEIPDAQQESKPKPQTPEDLIASLERVSQGKISNRKHERKSWVTHSTIQLQGPRDKRTLKVTTCDISRGGFSFILESYIAIGTPLEATFMVGTEETILLGVVRNCKIVHAPRHHIGVQFTNTKPEVAPEYAA